MKSVQKLITGASFALLGSAAYAGGLDRTPLNSSLLFESGTITQVYYSMVNPSVEGVVPTPVGDLKFGNVGEPYANFGFAYKADLSPRFSHILQMDRPYGADVDYENTEAALNLLTGLGGLNAHVASYRASYLVLYRLDERISLMGGFVGNEIKPSNASVPLPTGQTYKMTTNSTTGIGFSVGAAYEISEYAMRVSARYDSSITHTLRAGEWIDGAPKKNYSDLELISPASFTLEGQTGLDNRTLAFGSVRWSGWSASEIKPEYYASLTGSPLVDYEDNVMTYTVGLGRKINDQFNLLGSMFFEPSTDGDATLLAPTNGQTGFNIGGAYSFGDFSIRAGMNYTLLGDVEGKLPDGTPYEFKGNSSTGFGIAITHSY